MVEVPEVGAFLLGAPKCGTTWLAEILTQHPEICVSDPKEPNIVASHKGTFGRDDSEPDWVEYADCFNGCLLYTSPSPRDQRGSRMPSSA